MLLKIFLSSDNLLKYEFLHQSHSNIDNRLFTDQNVINCLENIFESTAKVTFQKIENDVSGIYIKESEISLFSAKYSKSRIYYSIWEEAIYVSFDLRNLFPYSSRRLDLEAAFSIIKFGELPEPINIIKDIYSVPSSSFVTVDNSFFKKIISEKKIKYNSYSVYNYINYTYSGGDLNRTQKVLEDSLQYFIGKKPNFLVSGGIDSTLLVRLFYEICGEEINAHFIDFEEAPEEYGYVKESLKGTKHQLFRHIIDSNNFINDFEKSIKNLIYPIYDNGSALTGYNLFNSINSKEQMFIEGTLADSCYGVRNYNKPIATGNSQVVIYSLFKEWLYFQNEKYNLNLINSKPRDSFVKSEFTQDLLWNSGAFTNLWFKNSKLYSFHLEKKLFDYLKLYKSKSKKDYWAEYTVLKLYFYAGKQTSVKTYDMKGSNQVFYPFMFNQIINDQSNYSWTEKSKNDVVKYPLKKLLEKYMPYEFIYRKKQGLQSQTLKWMTNSENLDYFISIIDRNDGIGHELMGKSLNKLIALYKNKKTSHLAVKNILSMSVIQKWIDIHKISY